jgi:hypothetical protein
LKIPAYIGITDFETAQQVLDMKQALAQTGSTRLLHVGVMISYKTLKGLPTKWAPIFPAKDKLKEIFSVEGVLNILHYADYEDRPDLANSLKDAVAFCGDKLQGIQLDMIWPAPKELATFCKAYPSIRIILQIGRNAMEQVGDSPEAAVARLASYQGTIAGVLLDRSMGQGKGMDAQALLPYARAIKKAFPELTLAAAGGLGPKSMHLVEPMLQEFPDLSIDAQGQLRPSGNAMNPVDWQTAADYLKVAGTRLP